MTAAFALAVGFCWSAGTAAAEPAPATAVTCSDVTFIGARGSGQLQSDHGGFGAEVYAAYAQIRSQAHFSLTPLPVVYPADSVDDFLPTLAELKMLTSGNVYLTLQALKEYVAGVEQYFASIAAGVTATKQLLQTYRRQCPSTRFILAGYSQGAMVMHTELIDLVQQGADGTTSSILANLLVGDGDRVPNTKAHLIGTAPPGDKGLRPYFGLTNSDVPAVFAARTYEVCNAGDIVCDTQLVQDVQIALRTTFPPLTLYLELYAAVLVHTQSYLTSPALAQATTAIVDGLVNQPLTCRSETLQLLRGSTARVANAKARDTGCVTAGRLLRAVDAQRPTSAGQALRLRAGNFSCTSTSAARDGSALRVTVLCRNGRAAVAFDYRA